MNNESLLFPVLFSCFTTLVLTFVLFRIRNCLAQYYAKEVTPDDKEELDEALQREVNIDMHFLAACDMP